MRQKHADNLSQYYGRAEDVTPMVRLQNMMCDIPNMVKDADALRKVTPDLQDRYRDLCQRIYAAFESHYEWRAEWLFLNEGRYTEVTPSSQEAKELFSTVLFFDSPVLVNDITLFDTSLLILLQLGQEIIGADFDPATLGLHLPGPWPCSEGLLTFPGSAIDPHALAIEICRSIEYHLTVENGWSGHSSCWCW